MKNDAKLFAWHLLISAVDFVGITTTVIDGHRPQLEMLVENDEGRPYFESVENIKLKTPSKIKNSRVI